MEDEYIPSKEKLPQWQTPAKIGCRPALKRRRSLEDLPRRSEIRFKKIQNPACVVL